jgi:putative membrane protein
MRIPVQRTGRAIANASCLAGGVAALAVAWGPLGSIAHGTLAGHMLQHLVVMNLAALLFAAALRPPVRHALAMSTALQIVMLWGWHVPAIYHAAHRDLILTLSMQASLLGVAFLFWSAVLAHPVGKSWQTILAALVTAKAFCLFGALLCFSRRALYVAHSDHGSPESSALEDQQLAGLLMMASCALVYVAAAVTLFLRWIDGIGLGAGEQPSWRQVDA